MMTRLAIPGNSERPRIYAGTGLVLLLGLLVNCFISPVHAQQSPPLVLESMKLPDKILRSAAQDSIGFLWFGSDNAIWKYNGHTFEQITQLPGEKNTLTFSPPVFVCSGIENDLWIGTKRGGISHLSHRTGKFSTWQHHPDQVSSLAGNRVNNIAVDRDGTIWAGTDPYCLNHLDPGTGVVGRYYPTTTKTSVGRLGKLCLDPVDSSLVWIAAADGLLVFNKKEHTFKHLTFPDSIVSNGSTFRSFSFVDPAGNIWVNAKHRLMKWLRQEQRWDPDVPNIWYEEDDEAQWHLVKYDEETIAVLSRIEGLYLHQVFTGTTQVVERTKPRFNRTEYGFHFLFKDAEGHLWTGTNRYLVRIAKPEWHAPFWRYPNGRTFKTLRPNWNLCYLNIPARNAVFVGTLKGNGLVYADFDRDSLTCFRYSYTGYRSSDVRMGDLSFDAGKNIWIASDAGLLKWQADDQKIVRIDGWKSGLSRGEPPDTAFLKSIFRRDSVLWIGSQAHGLFAYSLDKNKPTSWSFKYGGLLQGIAINRIAGVEDGRLLIGTNKGLCLYDPRTNQFHEDKRFLLPGVEITQIRKETQNRFWVSTFGHGLYLLDFSAGLSLKQYLTTFFHNGNEVYDFTLTRQHGIWMNTDGGTLSFDPESGSYRHYPEFGVAIKWAITQLPNGKILSSRSFGIRHFHPEELMQRKGILPVPYLSAINIANREEDFTLAPNFIRKITLQPGERELVIRFGALNFNRRPRTEFNEHPRTEFSYRLLGLHDNWKQVKGSKQLIFNNLPPRTYTLELRAVNEYGIWGTHVRRLEIQVLPPFYQTWWFRLAAILLVLLAGYAGYTLFRYRQMQKAHESAVAYFTHSHYAENSVDEIIWDLARNVISRLGFVDCVIYLLDDAEAVLMQKAAYGPKNPRGREISNSLSIPVGAGIVGQVAASGSPLLIPDIRHDTRHIRDLQTEGSELAVPILHEGKVLGVIDSEHPKKDFFQQAHVDVLVRIAAQCAQKIANAQVNEAIEKQEQELLNIQKEIAESRLTALQAQMNPHFIFNSLNSINWYILKNRPQEASRYLTKFSKLVRLILDYSKNLTIPFDKELSALKLYLDLEAMRFEHKFEYQIQIDASIELEEVLIPPLILQPFVENAIWHGLLHKKSKGTLLLQVYPENGHLKCIVEDNGIGRKAANALQSKGQVEHQSKGMKLTNERLQLLHRNFLKEDMIRVIDLEDENNVAVGTRVEVTIPYS